MRSEIIWMKNQLKDRKFQILVITGVIIAIALCAEFIALSYSILKIIRYLCLLWGMLILAWIDQHQFRIPNRILISLLMVRAILLVIEWIAVPSMGLPLLISSLSGAIFGGGLFLIVNLISRGGVGMGDVKLLAVIGAYVGSGSIMALVFITALLSALINIVMLMLKRINLKEKIAFAPYVLAGTILTMALGM